MRVRRLHSARITPTYALSLSLSNTLSLSPIHTNTHTLTHTHSLSVSLSLSLPPQQTHIDPHESPHTPLLVSQVPLRRRQGSVGFTFDEYILYQARWTGSASGSTTQSDLTQQRPVPKQTPGSPVVSSGDGLQLQHAQNTISTLDGIMSQCQHSGIAEPDTQEPTSSRDPSRHSRNAFLNLVTYPPSKDGKRSYPSSSARRWLECRLSRVGE